MSSKRLKLPSYQLSETAFLPTILQLPHSVLALPSQLNRTIEHFRLTRFSKSGLGSGTKYKFG